MNTDGFCMSGAGRVSHEGRRVAAISGQFAVPVGSAGAVACIAWEALNQAKRYNVQLYILGLGTLDQVAAARL